MSKWLKKDNFDSFKKDRDSDNTQDNNISFARKWRNPTMGSQNKPKE